MYSRILFRGLTRRCPRCGEWGIFDGYFRMKQRCPRCDLDLQREEGYYVGAMSVNIGVAELVTALALVVAIILTWPSLPVVELIIGGVALNIAFPILFYPFSKTIWLAIDLMFFHPLRPSELR